MPVVFDQARLERLLKEVRAALRNGDYQQTAALASEQDRIIGQLLAGGGGFPDKSRLSLIAEAARRNQRLIEAALAGLRSAARRRDELRLTDKPARTYDRTGRKIPLEPALGTLEKRS